MLLGGKQAKIKQVAVVTRNPHFSRLLSRILADWRFFTVEDLAAAEIIFAERGVTLPAHDGQVVWLSPMPLAEPNYLLVPISLTSLYSLLESRLFPTPRRHIRVPMEALVDLRVDDDWMDGRLLSLSDRGGRISCLRELPRGKSLTVSMKLAGKIFRIPSEVLYCLPAGDSAERMQAQIGVLFKPSNEEDLNLIRCLVERTCIKRACASEDILLTDPCVSWLELPS